MALSGAGRIFSRTGWSSYNILDPEDRTRLVNDGLKALDNWAFRIGVYGALLWTTVICIKILLFVCNVGVNLKLLHQVFGWSKKLIACCLTSLTSYLITRAIAPVEEVQEMATAPTPSTETVKPAPIYPTLTYDPALKL